MTPVTPMTTPPTLPTLPGPASLRPWTLADAPALHAAVRVSPDLHTQLGGSDLADVADCERFVADHLLPDGTAGVQLAVTVDDVAVGTVGLGSIERRHDTAWTFYWLSAEHRGRGLAVRSLATVAAWALGDLRLFRLELGHRVNNPASCRVATRAGFRAEGVERAKLRYGADRYDVETHARLATDPAPDVALLPLSSG